MLVGKDVFAPLLTEELTVQTQIFEKEISGEGESGFSLGRAQK